MYAFLYVRKRLTLFEVFTLAFAFALYFSQNKSPFVFTSVRQSPD